MVLQHDDLLEKDEWVATFLYLVVWFLFLPAVKHEKSRKKKKTWRRRKKKRKFLWKTNFLAWLLKTKPKRDLFYCFSCSLLGFVFEVTKQLNEGKQKNVVKKKTMSTFLYFSFNSRFSKQWKRWKRKTGRKSLLCKTKQQGRCFFFERLPCVQKLRNSFSWTWPTF